MTTTYPAGKPTYDCSRARADHATTPGCRSVLAAIVDGPVAERLLQVVAPEEIALALAAADEVADRHARSRRVLELRVERARYEAARAERAFHRREPENRLVARTLEQRWEAQLQELTEAERVLASDTRKSPIPPREEIEALARDLPRLWAAATTSAKDRKRLTLEDKSRSRRAPESPATTRGQRPPDLKSWPAQEARASGCASGLTDVGSCS